MFLALLGIGVSGLALLALPAFRHGRAAGRVACAHSAHHGAARPAAQRGAQLIPEPRTLFSLLALLGAFGNLFERFSGWGRAHAFMAGVLVALVIDLCVMRPVWRLALRFQGRPDSPLAGLALQTARAVTPFRNGKGIVELVRDGRSVQFPAYLVGNQVGAAVRVGDPVRVEDVDAQNERVTVSVV